ncbi:hypothetical protein EDD15DRAFT_2164504 [Pisolithus albus]|nr:hypothetical protein EDD15DRAFT_2164504 [Pisolithus albus]
MQVSSCCSRSLQKSDLPPSAIGRILRFELAHVSSAGTPTYVVSKPDPSNTTYEVPYCASYPTSAPYVNYRLADAPPNPEGKYSSTSSTQPYPCTT